MNPQVLVSQEPLQALTLLPCPRSCPATWAPDPPKTQRTVHLSQSLCSSAGTSSLTSVRPARQQTFVCRSTVSAPQARNRQTCSLIFCPPHPISTMDRFPDNSHHHCLCTGPGILKLSLQSFCRHAQEMKNPCQSLLTHWQLAPKHRGCLPPGAPRGRRPGVPWAGRGLTPGPSRVGSANPSACIAHPLTQWQGLVRWGHAWKT